MTLGKSSAERQALASAWITPVLLRRHFEISNTMVIMIMSSLGVRVQSTWSSSALRSPSGESGASMKSWVLLQRSDTNSVSSGVWLHWILINGVFICVMYYGREWVPSLVNVSLWIRLSLVLRENLWHLIYRRFRHREEIQVVLQIEFCGCSDRLMPWILM